MSNNNYCLVNRKDNYSEEMNSRTKSHISRFLSLHDFLLEK